MAPGAGSENIPKLTRFGLIACSSLGAEAVTFPIDFAKTRMQLAVGKQGFFDALITAVRVEGIGAVYAALPPAVMRHWVYTSLRISIYEDLRVYLAGGKGQPISFANAAGSSLLAGGIAQFTASPTDRIKVLVVQEGGKRSITQVGKDLIRQEGAVGLYRGVMPNVLRASSVNLGELMTYDISKKFVLQYSGLSDGIVAHSVAAFMSGLGASFCSTPADVIKSRVMGGQSEGIMSCIKTTMKNEGVLAFWKGFLPNWGRLGPWQLCFWVTYEKLRVLAGYNTFK